MAAVYLPTLFYPERARDGETKRPYFYSSSYTEGEGDIEHSHHRDSGFFVFVIARLLATLPPFHEPFSYDTARRVRYRVPCPFSLLAHPLWLWCLQSPLRRETLYIYIYTAVHIRASRAHHLRVLCAWPRRSRLRLLARRHAAVIKKKNTPVSSACIIHLPFFRLRPLIAMPPY